MSEFKDHAVQFDPHTHPWPEGVIPWDNWIDESAPYTLADHERIIASMNGRHEVKEIKPGTWQHTFTPERTVSFDDLIRAELPADAKHPSLAELNEMIEGMFALARIEPHMLYVSVEDMRRIRHADRIGRLYRAHPVPRRKIRKCRMRKLQATWRKGKEHIRRVEQAEIAREEVEMRRLREEHR